MISNKCATLYLKTGVSNKKSSKPALPTKQPPKKKRNQIIALFSEETTVLNHKPKIHKTYELK